MLLYRFAVLRWSVIVSCVNTRRDDECLAYYEDHRGELDLLVSRQMQTEA